MARNKYPEETVSRILEVSLRLFLEKGYEHTSIQDIVDGLGGLTKGAIYHHFKSKEEIIMAVSERLYSGTESALNEIRSNSSLNGLEKMKAMLRVSLQNPGQLKMFATAPNMLKTPRFLAVILEGLQREVVPLFLMPMMEEGIADGSIQTRYPKEIGEVMLLLSNLWLNPLVFPCDAASFDRRLALTRDLLEHYGLPVMDGEMEECLRNFHILASEKQEEDS